jgi:hypothetical protein
MTGKPETIPGTIPGQKPARGKCGATERNSLSDFLQPRFWGASELTILELISSVNTSALMRIYRCGTLEFHTFHNESSEAFGT